MEGYFTKQWHFSCNPSFFEPLPTRKKSRSFDRGSSSTTALRRVAAKQQRTWSREGLYAETNAREERRGTMGLVLIRDTTGGWFN